MIPREENRISVKMFGFLCIIWAGMCGDARGQELSSSSSSSSDSGSSSAVFGWPSPSDMVKNTSSPLFFHDVRTLMNATRLSYVSTYGGYYENWTVNETINPSWIRRHDYELNPPFGLRALLFLEPTSLRALIVFRGTDLTADLGGICDQCADAYLWGNTPYAALPPPCHQFNETTLDYLKGALHYSNAVAFAFPLYNILFTGHSLGAGLAATVSSLGNLPLVLCAPTNAGAVVFSAPGYIATLMKRTAVDLGLVDPKRVVNLADAWDPVWVGCNASLNGGLMARVCLWSVGTPSSQCLACDAQPSELPMNSTDCDVCMMQRHAFSHYEQLLQAFSSPVCDPVPRMECSSFGSCATSGWECSLS